MNGFPSQEVVKRLREEFPKDTRIALVRMDDPYTKLKPGDRGTVQGVDDAGNILVSWDKGSSLSIAYGEDSCRKLSEKELCYLLRIPGLLKNTRQFSRILGIPENMVRKDLLKVRKQSVFD